MQSHSLNSRAGAIDTTTSITGAAAAAAATTAAAWSSLWRSSAAAAAAAYAHPYSQLLEHSDVDSDIDAYTSHIDDESARDSAAAAAALTHPCKRQKRRRSSSSSAHTTIAAATTAAPATTCADTNNSSEGEAADYPPYKRVKQEKTAMSSASTAVTDAAQSRSSAAASVAVVSVAHTHPSSSSSAAAAIVHRSLQLLRLQPTDILRLITREYMNESEVVALDRTCTTALTLLRTYPIKKELLLSTAIRAAAAATIPVDSSLAAAVTTVSASPTTSCSPARRPLLIGSPVHVAVAVNEDGTTAAAAAHTRRRRDDNDTFTAATASHHLSLIPSVRVLTLTLSERLPPTALQRLRLSDSITSLRFSEDRPYDGYRGSLQYVHLPSKLKELILPARFNFPVTHLPQWQHCQHLHTIEFSGLFNQPVDTLQLPSSLTRLTLSSVFNQSIDRLRLPASLREVRLTHNPDQYSAFNQDIQQVQWPSSLTLLQLSSSFDQPVDALQLPHSLTHLDTGRCFNQPTSALRLPSNLRILKFGDRFNRPLDRVPFPPALTSLKLGYNFRQPLVEWQPPESLQMFHLSAWHLSLSQLRLPSKITTFTLPSMCNGPLCLLRMPATLTSLTVNAKCIHNTLGRIEWPSITDLTLTQRQNMDMFAIERTEVIRMCALQLPPSLTRLTAIDQLAGFEVADWILPPKLQHLHLRLSAHTHIRAVRLPDTLHTLLLYGGGETHSLAGCRLPSALHTLSLPDSDITHLIGVDWSHSPSLTSLTLGKGGIALPPHACELCGYAEVSSSISLMKAEISSLPHSHYCAAGISTTSAAAALASSPVCRLAHLLPRTLRILRFTRIPDNDDPMRLRRLRNERRLLRECDRRFAMQEVGVRALTSDNGDIGCVSEGTHDFAHEFESRCNTASILLPPTVLLPPLLSELSIDSFDDHKTMWFRQYRSTPASKRMCIPILLQQLPASLRTLHLGDVDLSLRAMPALPLMLQRLYLPLHRSAQRVDGSIAAANGGALPTDCAVLNSAAVAAGSASAIQSSPSSSSCAQM